MREAGPGSGSRPGVESGHHGAVSRPQPTTTPVDQIAPGDVVRDTEVHPVDGLDGRYRLDIPEAWRVVYAFGGVTMASAIRAVVAAVDRPDLSLVSADATFCQAVPCGPVAVQVEVLRQGRSAAQAVARLWALDPADPSPTGPVGSDLVVSCVLGERDPHTPYRLQGAVPPEVGPPEGYDPRPEVVDNPFADIPYHRQTDWRLAEGRLHWGQVDVPPGDPQASSWFRFHRSPMGPDGRWVPGLVAVPGDVLGPAVGAGIGTQHGFFLILSLQIGIRFVADVTTEWVLQHTRAQTAADGYAAGTAELWDEDRRLVALAHQIAKLRSF